MGLNEGSRLQASELMLCFWRWVDMHGSRDHTVSMRSWEPTTKNNALEKLTHHHAACDSDNIWQLAPTPVG